MSDDTWRAKSACRDVDTSVFFPESGHRSNEARDICKTCDVQVECLSYIMEYEPSQFRYGIWSNTNQKERREIAQRRDLSA